jgi:hypothetical protein
VLTRWRENAGRGGAACGIRTAQQTRFNSIQHAATIRWGTWHDHSFTSGAAERTRPLPPTSELRSFAGRPIIQVIKFEKPNGIVNIVIVTVIFLPKDMYAAQYRYGIP